MNYPNNLTKTVGIGVTFVILISSTPNISDQNLHCNFDCYQSYFIEQSHMQPHNEPQAPKLVQNDKPRAAATSDILSST